MKKVLGAVGNALLYAVMAVLLFMVLSGIYQRFVKKGNSGFFGIGYAVVVSGSMEPNLQINDMIVYQKKKVNQYAVGDVIVYEREKEGEGKILITHRIVSVDGMTLVTKGDANESADDPISFTNVAGLVVFRVPKVGAAMKFVKTKDGLIVTLAAAALIFFGSLLISGLVKKKRKENKAIEELAGKIERGAE